MNLPQQAIDLLNKAAISILDEPTKFDMRMWAQEDEKSPCGTTACIAGHILSQAKQLSSLKELYRFDVEDKAMEAMGMEMGAESTRLFFRSSWPADFFHAHIYAETPEDRADIAFWRIQHFIATDGAE